MSDKVIPKCRYASQATQKVRNSMFQKAEVRHYHITLSGIMFDLLSNIAPTERIVAFQPGHGLIRDGTK